MTGLIVFAHGSRVESANESVRELTHQVRQTDEYLVSCAFLELGQPDLSQAVGELAQHGVTRIIVVPYFLTLGIHLRRDLPRMVDELRTAHPAIDFEVTEPLDGHPGLLAAVLDRAKEAFHGGGRSESQIG